MAGSSTDTGADRLLSFVQRWGLADAYDAFVGADLDVDTMLGLEGSAMREVAEATDLSDEQRGVLMEALDAVREEQGADTAAAAAGAPALAKEATTTAKAAPVKGKAAPAAASSPPRSRRRGRRGKRKPKPADKPTAAKEQTAATALAANTSGAAGGGAGSDQSASQRIQQIQQMLLARGLDPTAAGNFEPPPLNIDPRMKQLRTSGLLSAAAALAKKHSLTPDCAAAVVNCCRLLLSGSGAGPEAAAKQIAQLPVEATAALCERGAVPGLIDLLADRRASRPFRATCALNKLALGAGAKVVGDPSTRRLLPMLRSQVPRLAADAMGVLCVLARHAPAATQESVGASLQGLLGEVGLARGVRTAIATALESLVENDPRCLGGGALNALVGMVGSSDRAEPCEPASVLRRALNGFPGLASELRALELPRVAFDRYCEGELQPMPRSEMTRLMLALSEHMPAESLATGRLNEAFEAVLSGEYGAPLLREAERHLRRLPAEVLVAITTPAMVKRLVGWLGSPPDAFRQTAEALQAVLVADTAGRTASAEFGGERTVAVLWALAREKDEEQKAQLGLRLLTAACRSREASRAFIEAGPLDLLAAKVQQGPGSEVARLSCGPLASLARHFPREVAAAVPIDALLSFLDVIAFSEVRHECTRHASKLLRVVACVRPADLVAVGGVAALAEACQRFRHGVLNVIRALCALALAGFTDELMQSDVIGFNVSAVTDTGRCGVLYSWLIDYLSRERPEEVAASGAFACCVVRTHIADDRCPDYWCTATMVRTAGISPARVLQLKGLQPLSALIAHLEVDPTASRTGVDLKRAAGEDVPVLKGFAEADDDAPTDALWQADPTMSLTAVTEGDWASLRVQLVRAVAQLEAEEKAEQQRQVAEQEAKPADEGKAEPTTSAAAAAAANAEQGQEREEAAAVVVAQEGEAAAGGGGSESAAPLSDEPSKG